MSEKHIGRIIKAFRIMAGNGLRGFADAIGIQPSRMSDIGVGAAATDAELDAIATEIERTWQDGIAWRERIVDERDRLTAQLAAAESELARVVNAIPDAVNCLFISPGGQEAVRLMLLDKVQYELWRWSSDEAIEIVRNYLLSAGEEAKDASV